MSTEKLFEVQDNCRVCHSKKLASIHDFGTVPLADKLGASPESRVPEAPLSLSVCQDCFHLQIDQNVEPSILFENNYPYFSSHIPELRNHFSNYAEDIAARYDLSKDDTVIEIASNDGLLLGYLQAYTDKVIGIEPSIAPATLADERGVNTIRSFFTKDFAKEFRSSQDIPPRLIIANNVLAHVPDPAGFVAGISMLCGEHTVVIVEVPHVLPMIQNGTFDVIYHQHYSYFSLHVLILLFSQYGLFLQLIQQVPTQGGSLRLHLSTSNDTLPEAAKEILEQENSAGLLQLDTYRKFSDRLRSMKVTLLSLLNNLQEEGKTVAGYGAPGKAATFLNYFELDQHHIAFLVDISPSKQNKFFPKANFPIYPVEYLEQETPDYIIILVWNYADSIMRSLHHLHERGTKFILLYPEIRIV